MNFIFLSLMLLAQPAGNQNIGSDADILRIILDDSGLGIAQPRDSATDLGQYRSDVEHSIPFIRSLFSRMAKSSAELLRIQEGIAKVQLGKVGVDIGPEAIVAYTGGLGIGLFVGSYESPRGRRWIHMGFSSRLFKSFNPTGFNIGLIAGISGRRFLSNNHIDEMYWMNNQSGLALGLGAVIDRNQYLKSNNGVLIGAGLGYMGASETDFAAIRFPLLPLPHFLGSPTVRALRRLERLQSKIVLGFHSQDLHEAEKNITRFERELENLKVNLAERWLTAPSFEDASLPAMHPFNSIGSLYHPSRIDGLNRGLLRNLLRACGL